MITTNTRLTELERVFLGFSGVTNKLSTALEMFLERDDAWVRKELLKADAEKAYAEKCVAAVRSFVPSRINADVLNDIIASVNEDTRKATAAAFGYDGPVDIRRYLKTYDEVTVYFRDSVKEARPESDEVLTTSVLDVYEDHALD